MPDQKRMDDFVASIQHLVGERIASIEASVRVHEDGSETPMLDINLGNGVVIDFDEDEAPWTHFLFPVPEEWEGEPQEIRECPYCGRLTSRHSCTGDGDPHTPHWTVAVKAVVVDRRPEAA